MSLRSKTAIVFAVIFALEIILYFSYSPIVPLTTNLKYLKFHLEEMEMVNTRYMIIIFSTVAIGAIVTFAMPNKKEDNNEHF